MTRHLRAVVLPDGVTRDVFVAGNRITFEQQDDAETVLDGGYLVPGLVDAHAHLALASPAGDGATADERVRASARAHLDAGVLLVREPGSPNRASRNLGPDEGLPRVRTAGRFLAPPGGYFPGLAREAPAEHLPDVADEEARASGAWVKVIADFPDGEGVIRANYPVEALAEAVTRAHAAGARLAIHVMSVAGMDLAVEARVDSIEHGIGMTDDHARVMAAAQIAFVPTMAILPVLDNVARGMGITGRQLETSLADFRRHPQAVRRAADGGVLVLAGTDAGLVPHGIVGDEVRRLLAAGLSGAQALGAASWTARSYLGLPGIEEGAPADIVAFADDPREDATTLDRPVLRMLGGRLVGYGG